MEKIGHVKSRTLSRKAIVFRDAAQNIEQYTRTHTCDTHTHTRIERMLASTAMTTSTTPPPQKSISCSVLGFETETASKNIKKKVHFNERTDSDPLAKRQCLRQETSICEDNIENESETETEPESEPESEPEPKSESRLEPELESEHYHQSCYKCPDCGLDIGDGSGCIDCAAFGDI